MVTFLLCSAWVIIFSKLLSAALAVSLLYPLGWRAGRMLNPMYPNQWIIAFLVVYFIPLDQEPSKSNTTRTSFISTCWLLLKVSCSYNLFLPCCPYIPSLLKMRQPKLYAWGKFLMRAAATLCLRRIYSTFPRVEMWVGLVIKKECYSSSRSSKGIGRSANHNL